ncbi:MAG: hypothetical protein C0412_19325 [Flavobacterium sp.]|nr:hypothetical protein [Flavobacterium sp.]
METSIFEAHYKDYCHQIAALNFSSMKDTLGLELRGQEAIVPFLDTHYIVSDKGIADEFGNRPNYMVCVIISKYLLLCPDTPVVDKEWATLKDFRKMSQSANLNIFSSETERPIVKLFSSNVRLVFCKYSKDGEKKNLKKVNLMLDI